MMLESVSVVFIAASLHLQGLNVNPQHYQQFNPGIGVELERHSGIYSAGFYRDSYGKGATFLAWSPCHGWGRPFIGIADGYLVDRYSATAHTRNEVWHNTFGRISPIAGLEVEPWKKRGPVFTITPMNLHGIVIGFAWKEKFK